MTRHERRPHSRLPDDDAWWDDLAARSVRAALGPAAARPAESGGTVPIGRRVRRPAWWRALSDSAVVLAASAVLALLGGALLIGERDRSGDGDVSVAGALAPEDPLLRTLLGVPAEPDAAALLRLVALREEAR